MPLTRQQKERVVADAEQGMAGATSVVFVAFDGLTVSDMTQLRDRLHQSGSTMRVVPKRLLRLVMKSRKVEFDPLVQAGQLAVVWGPDAVAPAKTLYEFTKEHENLRLLAGTLEGNLLAFEQVQSLAQLPGREELYAKLVGTLVGPMRGLVGVLSGVPRATVYVLQAVREQKQ